MTGCQGNQYCQHSQLYEGQFHHFQNILKDILSQLCLVNWSHGQHLVDSSIALCTKSLTASYVYAFILSKHLIALLGFPRLGTAFYTQTAHECAYSKLNDVRHAWYVVSQRRPLDSAVLKGWLEFASHRVIWGSVISSNSKYMAPGELKTIQNFFPMYGLLCSSMLTLDRSSWISFQNFIIISHRPHWMQVVLLAMPNFDQSSMQWPMLWLICLVDVHSSRATQIGFLDGNCC